MQRAQKSHHATLANAIIIHGQGTIGAFLYSVRLSLLAEEKMGFPCSNIKDRLSEDGIRPCKPAPCINVSLDSKSNADRLGQDLRE